MNTHQPLAIWKLDSTTSRQLPLPSSARVSRWCLKMYLLRALRKHTYSTVYLWDHRCHRHSSLDRSADKSGRTWDEKSDWNHFWCWHAMRLTTVDCHQSFLSSDDVNNKFAKIIDSSTKAFIVSFNLIKLKILRDNLIYVNRVIDT